MYILLIYILDTDRLARASKLYGQITPHLTQSTVALLRVIKFEKVQRKTRPAIYHTPSQLAMKEFITIHKS